MDNSVDANNSHKTVVYIEDNPTNLKLVEQLVLKRPNTEIQTSMMPREGLELINQVLPDLILLDINLPGMSGFEILEVLKQNQATSSIPVVAISANAMQEDIDKGTRAGFNDYITKPVNIPLFFNMLDKYLA